MQTIGNITIELEYFAGKVLKYIAYPSGIPLLAQCLASLPDMSKTLHSEIIPKIKKLIIHKNKRLVLSNLFKFYRGELPELFELLMVLISELEAILPTLEGIKLAEHEAHIIDTFTKLQSLQDLGQTGKLINVTPPEPWSVVELQVNQDEIRAFIKNAKACLSLYGRGAEETIPTKQWKFGTAKDTKLSSYYLQQQLLHSEYPVKLISIVSLALDSLNTLAVQMVLDPLYKDIEEDLYRFLINPETYEHACKTKQVSEKVGGFFSSIYPEHTKEAGMELLKTLSRASEDEEICIGNGLGIVRDSGALTTLCSQYVNRNYR